MDKIIQDYRGNGRKITFRLLQRQSGEIDKVSRVFQRDCKQLYDAYENASKDVSKLRGSILSKRKRLDDVVVEKRQCLQNVRDVIRAGQQDMIATS